VSAPLLEVKDLHAAYGLSRVLFGVSLEVHRGECVCLLGRNGVGKSTTLRAIMGLTPPSAGTVRWQGREVTGWAPNRAARAGVGFVPEDRRIFSELTVWENLDVAQRAAGRRGAWTVEGVYNLFPKLRELADRAGGNLSGGEQQMLTIARTLMGNPELLLLDEPSEGLAPLVVDAILQRLKRLKAAGTTVLISEQNLRFATELADRVLIIERGAIPYAGTPAELSAHPEVREKYLMV